MFPMRPISLFTALALLAPITARDGVEIRWHFKAGDALRYRMMLEQTTEMSMMPEPMNVSVGYVFREDVKEVAADGTASIDIAYEAVRMELNVGGDMSFDSTLTGDAAKANEPKLAKMFKPMLEGKVHMKLEPSGRLSEMTGAKEMLAKVLENADGGSSNPMFERMFSEDSMRKMFETNIFPEKALATGDTWKRDFDQPAPPLGAIKFAIDNKLEGQEQHGGNACAKISMLTKMTIVADDSAQLSMHVKMDDSLGKGTMWFDTQNGRMSELNQTMELKMSIGQGSEDAGSEDGGMQITSSVSTTMLLLGKDAPAFEREPAKK